MSPALRTTCGVCNGAREVRCTDDCFEGAGYVDGHDHPCSACRGNGSNPLRSLDDEADERIEALEAEVGLLGQAVAALLLATGEDGTGCCGICHVCEGAHKSGDQHEADCPVAAAIASEPVQKILAETTGRISREPGSTPGVGEGT